MKKIFDCFTFFNELDILKIRFRDIYDVVDVFVVCESTATFQGREKPLYFEDNRDMFAPYLDKVVHVVVSDMPGPGAGAWEREYFQRNALKRGLGSIAADDVVIISDCDEIVSRSAVTQMRQESGYFLLDMSMYQFYLNMQSHPSGWMRPFAYTASLSDEIGDFSYNRLHDEQVLGRFGARGHRISNAGWHFTYLGGPAAVVEKLRAYSHGDGWHRKMQDPAAIAAHMQAMAGVDSNVVLRFRPVDRSFPRYVVDHQADLEARGLLRRVTDYVADLENVYEGESNRRRRLEKRVDLVREEVVALKRRVRGASLLAPACAVNLIPSSADFGRDWIPADGDELLDGQGSATGSGEHDLAVCHGGGRGASETGRYRLPGLAAGTEYVASCFVRQPPGSVAALPEIRTDADWSEGGMTLVSGHQARGWSRVWLRFRLADATDIVHVWLAAGRDEVFESRGWQVEDAKRPSRYCRTTIPNLLAGPARFDRGWHVGVQTSQALLGLSDDVPRRYRHSAVMRHRVDGHVAQPDGNVGFYEVPVKPGHEYTASAWVWIPSAFAGTGVKLSLGEWLGQGQIVADLSRRDVWQRVVATAIVPEAARNAALVLRVTSPVPTDVYSTAWKLEREGPASSYRDPLPRTWRQTLWSAAVRRAR